MQGFDLEQHGSLRPFDWHCDHEVRHETLPLLGGLRICSAAAFLRDARRKEAVDLSPTACLHLLSVFMDRPLDGIVLRSPSIAWEVERREVILRHDR